MTADTVTCPRCGVEQDPARPVCCHLLGQKGGRAASARLGHGHYVEIGRKGGARVRELTRLARAGRTP